MGGKEATRQIKALPNGKNTVVVALTASVFEDQRDELFKAGVDAFVSKPYRIDEIFSCLHQCLNVEFIYQALELQPAYVSDHVPTERFKKLPAALQSQLHHAAAQLDLEQTASVIAKINALDKNVATGLQHYLEQMDFQAILDLCESG